LRGADAAGEGAKPAESKVASRLPGAKLRLSLAAYSFRQLLSGQNPSMSLEEFVDLCAREGLEGTELTSYYFRRTDPEYLYSLRRRAYVNGLTISGTPVGNNFCVPPGDKRDKELAHVKSWIDHVAMLGSQTIRVFAGSAPKDQSEADVKAWAVDCLKQVSDYAGKRGVLLGLENHGGITSTVEQLLGLVAAVDSPWLGVNLDTGNFHERVYESIEAAAPYAVAVQVKVEVSERGKAKEEADLARIVRILRGAGYRGFVALEYEAAEDPRQAVPRWLGRLREAAASER
jgi:sugar phosphate isomerase/epimerase